MRRKRFGDSTGDEKVLLGRYAATQCRHCAVQPVLLRPLALTGASQWLAGLHTAPLPTAPPAARALRGCSHGARLPVRVLKRYSPVLVPGATARFDLESSVQAARPSTGGTYRQSSGEYFCGLVL